MSGFGTRSRSYRALVCMTTCQRLEYLQRHLPHLAMACTDDPRFALTVAIDGNEPATLEFCRRWRIPAVYSTTREGVGISKNRVLKTFPDFDYYFFLDDDAELVEGSVFPQHVELARASGIPHFSLFVRGGTRQAIGTSVIAGVRVVHCLFGGGSFNFFTGEGLRRVGGWHPVFAKYRRWGHTEHSYRFFRAGLAPAPFNVAEDLASSFLWHSPPAVSKISGVKIDSDQLSDVERTLIDEGLAYFPVETPSPVLFNGLSLGGERALAETLDSRDRYPLLEGKAHQHARSDFELWRFENAKTRHERALGLVRATWSWPRNPALRHAIKVALRG